MLKKPRRFCRHIVIAATVRTAPSRGGVNYMLDRDQLVARRKLVPGETAKSRIIKRIQSEEMPPEGEKQRPTSDELALLKQWITAGAPDFNPARNRVFIRTPAVLDAIQADLSKLPANDQRFTRYFSITHLYNTGLSEDELTTYRQGISKLINSLSWGRGIAVPEPIDAARTLFRIDLRDYKWSTQNWDTLEAHYPYGVLTDIPAEKNLLTNMRTRFLFLRGDWFVAAAALPPLYHELLRLPTTDRALEKQLLVDVKANLEEGAAIRAGFNSSGVSRNNRLIERHTTLYGSYWKSYDFGGNTGNQNLFAFPLGPARSANAFIHDGGEIVFNLPNGLQGYMLVDAQGRQIDKGPTQIVSDPRRPDRAVVNGLSCMSCHSRGIIAKEDQIRPHVQRNRNAFTKDELERILALYGSQEQLSRAMDEDAERFRKAVEKTGAKVSTTEAIVALVQRFEAEMDVTLAAAELGIPAAELTKQFDKSVTLGRLLGPLAIAGGTVQREVFTEAFPAAIRDLGLGKALPVERRTRFSWSDFNRPPNSQATNSTIDPPTQPPITIPAKEKKPRKLIVSTPGSRYEDTWYFFANSHESGELHALAIAPTDKWLVAYESKIGVVSIWSRTYFEMQANMAGHSGSVLSLDFSPDARWLASGSIDQTARIWDAETGEEMHTLAAHAGFVRAVKFAPNGVWLATASERVRIWDVVTGKEKASFDKTPDWITALAISSDSRVIASAAAAVQLWDAATSKLIAALEDRQDVRTVAFSPNGKTLAAGCGDGAILLYDVDARRLKATLTHHSMAVTSVAFNPAGNLLLSTGAKQDARDEPGEYKVWDIEGGKELASAAGHKNGISCVAIAADGWHAITSSYDGHFRFRSLLDFPGLELAPFEGHFTGPGSLALSRDGRIALTGGDDSTVRIWDVATGRELHCMRGHTDRVREAILSADDRFAFTASNDKTIRKWDVKTGQEVQRWDFTGPILRVAVSADGETMMALIHPSVVRVWDIKSGKKRLEVNGAANGFALSPDGLKLSGRGSQEALRIWDVRTGAVLSTIGDANSYFWSVQFSADSKQLLTGDRDRYVCLWDVATGKEIRRYKGHRQEVRCATFLADDRRILASSGAPRQKGAQDDGGSQLILWDTATGEVLSRWNTWPHWYGGLAVSADGRLLIHPGGNVLKKMLLPGS